MNLTRYRTIPGRKPRFAFLVSVKVGDRMVVFDSKAKRKPIDWYTEERMTGVSRPQGLTG